MQFIFDAIEWKMTQRSYDDFSENYDKFVNWDSRLCFELPFIEEQIRSLGTPARILDAACGTGMHAVALAQRGYQVAGADLSEGMVQRARANSAKAKQSIQFECVGFGGMAQVFGENQFDAILCLGNSLPHVLSFTELEKSIRDFGIALRSGGLVMIQNRNFEAVLRHKDRWMDPQSYREGEEEWLFIRFYDYLMEGMLNFNIITLHKEADQKWQQSITSTQLFPFRRVDLLAALKSTGFGAVQVYGDMSGSEYYEHTSGNLVITALKI